jgi:hypothetical protein
LKAIRIVGYTQIKSLKLHQIHLSAETVKSITDFIDTKKYLLTTFELMGCTLAAPEALQIILYRNRYKKNFRAKKASIL